MSGSVPAWRWRCWRAGSGRRIPHRSRGSPAWPCRPQSAVLMEKETGTLLYEQQAHQVMEPASVTKIMTLLLVMEPWTAGPLPRTRWSPSQPTPRGWGAPRSI